MAFLKSDRLQDLVDKRVTAGMGSRVRKLCTKTVHGGYQSIKWMEKGMLLAEEFMTMRPNVIKVVAKNDLYFFDLSYCTEGQWCEKLEKLQIKTGKHQLAKMVSVRLIGIRKTHDVGVYGEFPELSSRAALDQYVKAVDPVPGFHYWREKWVLANPGKDHWPFDEWVTFCRTFALLKKVAARDDVNDAILKQAWGFAVAQEILES